MMNHDSSNCGCCEGIDTVTPKAVNNPPGLDSIAYRIGVHGDFLESMRAQLSSADAPALAALTTRESSDFTLALADALAGSLDVLTFYTERVANEHYLRTATERLSIREMARLIGYRLAPGVAASTHLAFILKTVPGVPIEPITIPVGTQVQSVPGQEEQAQTFETIVPVFARADWNAIAVQQDITHKPAYGDTELWLNSIDSGLSVGDQLLIVGSEFNEEPDGERWDVRAVTEVTPVSTRGITRVRWQEGLGSQSPFSLPAGEGVQIFTFKKRTSVFGSAAPDWRALSDDMKASYLGLESATELIRPDDTEEWPDFSARAPVYPEKRHGGGTIDDIVVAATIEEVAAAVTASAQGSAVMAMQNAASASAGVITAGGQLVQESIGFARQTTEGLNDIVSLGIEDVSSRARSLISSQAQALQGLQLSTGALVNHMALQKAKDTINDQLADLPQKLVEFAAAGLVEPIAIARQVLEDLKKALEPPGVVPAVLLPQLDAVWNAAMAAFTDQVSILEIELDDTSIPPWLSDLTSNDAAKSTLEKVSTSIDDVTLDAGALDSTAADIVKEVVENFKNAVGEQFTADHFSTLLDPSNVLGNVQEWVQAIFHAGGSVGQSLSDLQQNIVEAAGVEFSKMGLEVVRLSEQARHNISTTAELLNPFEALALLESAAAEVGTQTKQAGLAALRATAAADLAAIVTTAVTIARQLPAPLAVDTPEQLAQVVRYFAGVAVTRAGGSPIGEDLASEKITEISSRLPTWLLDPLPAVDQLLPLFGEVEEFLNAPRDGAQAAYHQVISDLDVVMLGKIIATESGRRNPLVREPDAIDISPLDEAVIAGGWALLSVPGSTELYRISNAVSASRAEYLLSGQTTRLTLSGELPGNKLPTEFEHDVRSLAVHVQSEALTLARWPLHGPVYGDYIALNSLQGDLQPDQILSFSGKRQRIEIARGVENLVLLGDDGTERTLEEGDTLLMTGTPDRLIGVTPHHLNPDAFAAVLGQSGVLLRLGLQDRDGLEGVLELHANEFLLSNPLENDLAVSEILLIVGGSDAITHDRDRSYLKLTEPTTHIYARNHVHINANVAPATHGETVEAILGSGDGSVANQQFELNQQPLTFVSANTSSGMASTLELRVNDVLWQEVPALHAQAPDTHVYETRQSDTAITTLQFGDGLEGARLPTGESNVRARYRKGLGIAGNVGAGKLTTLLSRPLGVSDVNNPEAATGGDDAETIEQARDNAPLTVLTLERAVSIDDYANFARAFAGIEKAHALWVPAGPAQGVFLSIGGVEGANVPESSDTYINLAKALATYGDPLVPLRIQNYRDARFRIRLSVKVLSTFEPEKVFEQIEDYLRRHFSFTQREFGAAVSVDEVSAFAQSVSGVEAVHVTRLHRSGTPPRLAARLFASLPTPSLTDIPDAAELLTLDNSAIELQVMP